MKKFSTMHNETLTKKKRTSKLTTFRKIAIFMDYKNLRVRGNKNSCLNRKISIHNNSKLQIPQI